MPDFTDPDLLPFPLAEEYGDEASAVEELARAVDPLILAQNARITALATRPTVIRRRSADVALTTAFDNATALFDAVDHDNFSAPPAWATPAVGAHPVAGVYPALWRIDAFCFVVAGGTITVGAKRELRIDQGQFNTATGFLENTRTWFGAAAETNTGGEYLTISCAAWLDRPASYNLNIFFDAASATLKAGSWVSMTRILGV